MVYHLSDYNCVFFECRQVDNDADESEKPVADPLGLTDNDLRDIQNLHSKHSWSLWTHL